MAGWIFFVGLALAVGLLVAELAVVVVWVDALAGDDPGRQRLLLAATAAALALAGSLARVNPRWPTAVAVVAAALAWSARCHDAVDHGVVGFSLDAVHLLAGAVWVGALALLVVDLRRDCADTDKLAIARRDTDHFAPGGEDALWAWRTFLRGHHPILMDFGIIDGVNPPDPKPGDPSPFEAFEPARFAMGDTIRYARRMRLIEMEPRGDLSSTGYALANPGVDYLALQPASSETITMTLDPGTYSVEWFGVDDRETVQGGDVTVRDAGPVSLEPPSDGPSVVYLTAT